MSATWNGKPMYEGGESSASRCLAILEVGLRRFGIDPRCTVPVAKLHHAPAISRPEVRRSPGRPSTLAARIRKMVDECRANPLAMHPLYSLAKRHSMKTQTARVALIAAGLLEREARG